jgi:LysR family transcriptional regulator, glycine cleavage system transcriptional activator
MAPRPLLDLPPLELVRSFVAVGRAMSITLAARELCVTQSAVSRQVRALEDWLHCALFVRSHRRIELTQEGARLFRSADAWLEQLGETVAALRPSGSQQAVTVTATVGVASLWLLPRIGEFQTAHPRLDLRVVTSNRVVDLEREHIDLAIRYAPDADAVPGAVRLFGEELVPVAHASLQVAEIEAPDVLKRHVLLEYDDPSYPQLQWSAWLRAARVRRARPASIVRFNHYDQVVQAALAGQGVALGRLELVRGPLAAGRLTLASRLPPRTVAYAYWLLARASPVSAVADVVRRWILAEAKVPAPASAAPDGRARRR